MHKLTSQVIAAGAAQASYGSPGLYDSDDAAPAGEGAATHVTQRNRRAATPQAASDIDTLRSINAHLIREIAVLKRREAQALRLADRDGLTGLYNRRRMSELLDTAIAEASLQRHLLGLLFIDLDGFKHINDHYGHAMGDELLINAGRRIAARARTGDIVCRYGGDEFIVLLPRVPDRAAALEVAANICERVALPHRIGGEELRVSAAIGVSMYPEDGHNAAQLLNRADERMYRAKALMAHSLEELGVSAAPSRRRDDKSKRRLGW
jgi:diguanylate cyclase (GGDEF)-like protein